MAPQQRKHCKILVVDDEPDSARLLVYILGMAGYLAESVNNGIEALEMLQHDTVDLIISDLVNAPIDGYELLRRLKAKDLNPPIPCLIVSSSLMEPGVLPQIEKLGAAGWAPKPFTREHLLGEVKRVLAAQEC